MDLVIRNARIVSPTEITCAGIAIDKGKIVAIGSEEMLPLADNTIDAGGKYILPGVVDPHMHPGVGLSFENCVSAETKAAALGGVTTVGFYDAIRYYGKKQLVGAFDEYKKAFEDNAVTDGIFHLMVSTDEILAGIPKCYERGITGFKFLIGYKGPHAEALGFIPIDDGFCWEGFTTVAKLGWPAKAMVHAENMDISLRLRKGLEHRQDARVWHDSRPNFVEEECIRRIMFLCEVAECPLYIVHNTIAESVELFAEAKARAKIPLIMETCPQYLTHNTEEPVPVVRDNPTFVVVNPPLRGKKDNEVLWQGIKDGVVDILASDQSPVTKAAKGRDVWKAIMGTGNGTQMILPVMLSDGVNIGRVSLEKVVEVCCQNPAQVFGLYPQKGTISVGSDADIVIVDMDKKVKFTATMSPSICDWSIYEGWEFKGFPVLTMLRGNITMEEGKLVGKPGIGRYCPAKTK